ncbi:DciA family protein [uncultured Massilia sp.]|uniref:DciA family protein n=1 Tax=uncultured Massilia sp. TaxID=169973 RepID=UPI0025EDD84D|nr:DciA family protein [uncultured Massilia sp.]
MQSSPPPRPFHIYGTRDRKTAFGATDFLRSSDRLAALLPNAMRMGNLQRDCRLILPPMYTACEVVSLQESVLSLAVPSSAVAAKLKQQVPKLQAALQKKGWQVEAIRIKIRMGSSVPVREQAQPSSLRLPATAVDAFEELGETLEETAQNAPLIAAIRRLAEKRKKQG